MTNEQKISVPSMPYVIPALAGAILLATSLLPWLNDPLGSVYTAWAIPLDIGWHLRSHIISYGLLCACCAIASFLLAHHQWLSSRTSRLQRSALRSPVGGDSSYLPATPVSSQDIQALIRWQLLTALLCLVPILLFLLQYLAVDIQSIDTLAQHKLQFLLIQQHLGYRLADQPIQLQPFQVDITTIQGRMILLTDQIAAGLAGPLLSSWLLIGYLPFASHPHTSSMDGDKREVAGLLAEARDLNSRGVDSAGGEVGSSVFPVGLARLRASFARNRRLIRVASAIFIAVIACSLMRAPLAVISEAQARAQLAAGDYPSTTWWLKVTRSLNPELAQMPSYHEEQGQIWYFTHPGSSNTDSHLYLASVYRARGDYLNAYQELLEAWNTDRQASWIKVELGLTVALMAENVPQKVKGTSLLASDLEMAPLTWLQMLAHVDNSNLYSQYYMGRIHYDKHDYAACIAQMNTVLRLSRNNDIRSSAYTYIALSLRGEGNIDEARHLLLTAIALDPYYHNNTAREELSGLH